MKKTFRTYDWCKYKGEGHPIWITSIKEDKIEGLFIANKGACYPMWLESEYAKPCSTKEVDALIKSTMSLGGDTEFARMYERGTFFVSRDKRLKALLKLKAEIDSEIKRMKKL